MPPQVLTANQRAIKYGRCLSGRDGTCLSRVDYDRGDLTKLSLTAMLERNAMKYQQLRCRTMHLHESRLAKQLLELTVNAPGNVSIARVVPKRPLGRTDRLSQVQTPPAFHQSAHDPFAYDYSLPGGERHEPPMHSFRSDANFQPCVGRALRSCRSSAISRAENR
jgi:hypothetical protein